MLPKDASGWRAQNRPGIREGRERQPPRDRAGDRGNHKINRCQ